MEDLNGIANIGMHGTVLGVVDSIRSLNSIGWLPEEGAVLHAADQIGDWSESGPIIDALNAGLLKGGSNIHRNQDSAKATWFQIDTMIYKDYLYIMPSSYGTVQSKSFGITQPDGKSLPAWLKITRQGLIVGRPPAGMTHIDLRIHGVAPDGTVSDTIRIDLHTGAALDHFSDPRSEVPALFSDYLMMASGMERANSRHCCLRLRNGRTLPMHQRQLIVLVPNEEHRVVRRQRQGGGACRLDNLHRCRCGASIAIMIGIPVRPFVFALRAGHCIPQAASELLPAGGKDGLRSD